MGDVWSCSAKPTCSPSCGSTPCTPQSCHPGCGGKSSALAIESLSTADIIVLDNIVEDNALERQQLSRLDGAWYRKRDSARVGDFLNGNFLWHIDWDIQDRVAKNLKKYNPHPAIGFKMTIPSVLRFTPSRKRSFFIGYRYCTLKAYSGP